MALTALATASLALAGCSSGDGSGTSSGGGSGTKPANASAGASGPAGDAGAKPRNSGAGSAHLTYSGGATGEFTITSVGCAVEDGKLIAIAAPDINDEKASTPPAFTANITDGQAMATLITPEKKSFVHTSTPGVTGRQSGGTWIATVKGLQLGPTDGGDSITVNGTISCGSVAGS